MVAKGIENCYIQEASMILFLIHLLSLRIKNIKAATLGQKKGLCIVLHPTFSVPWEVYKNKSKDVVVAHQSSLLALSILQLCNLLTQK